MLFNFGKYCVVIILIIGSYFIIVLIVGIHKNNNERCNTRLYAAIDDYKLIFLSSIIFDR